MTERQQWYVVGEVVKLRSGGPDLTVVKSNALSDGDYCITGWSHDPITCKWIDSTGIDREISAPARAFMLADGTGEPHLKAAA